MTVRADVFIEIDNTEEALLLIRRRVSAGFDAAARKVAGNYFDYVTEVQEPGPPFRGPHSSPGEYPYRETGRGSRSIRAINGGIGNLESRAGVTPDGAHLAFLSMERGRKGIDDTLYEDRKEVARAWINGARGVRY